MRLESNTSFRPAMRLYASNYARILGVTAVVDENEPALCLQEGYAMNREGQDRRYQVIAVATPGGNDLATFYWDLGPSEGFVTKPIDGEVFQLNPYLQWAEWEHSVAELRAAAELTRDDDFGPQLLNEAVQSSRIIERYWELMEEDRQLVTNRSTYGPGGVVQRNGFSNEAARIQQQRAAERGEYPQHGY